MARVSSVLLGESIGSHGPIVQGLELEQVDWRRTGRYAHMRPAQDGIAIAGGLKGLSEQLTVFLANNHYCSLSKVETS
jgi:hypothetical protein